MRDEEKIIKIDQYIQLFEGLQELAENEEKLTLQHRQELEKRLDFLTLEIFGEIISDSFYRKTVKAWEELLNQLSLLIEGHFLAINGETIFKSRVEKLEMNIKKSLTSYGPKCDKKIS